jgi:hypothetical protein
MYTVSESNLLLNLRYNSLRRLCGKGGAGNVIFEVAVPPLSTSAANAPLPRLSSLFTYAYSDDIAGAGVWQENGRQDLAVWASAKARKLATSLCPYSVQIDSG